MSDVITPGELLDQLDHNSVLVAASGEHLFNYTPMKDEYLPPRLWEAFRIELQRRWRRSTGETNAILTVSYGETDE